MKFNVCIQNPPYKAHVEFVNLGIEVADKVVAIHPGNEFIKPKIADDKLISNVRRYYTSIETKDAKPLFSAHIEYPLSLTVINTLIEDEEIIFNGAPTVLGQMKIAGVWANKFEALATENNVDMNMNVNSGSINKKTGVPYVKSRGSFEGKWYVNCCWKPSGNGSYESNPFFYNIVSDYVISEERLVNKPKWFSVAFETKQEAENFVSYAKTKFARFMLSLYKTNGSLVDGSLRSVPWMDFTQEWTDEKLFAKFNVSQEDQEKINSFIPDYY